MGLLSSVADGDLEAVPFLCDLLEERGDPRAEPLRRLYVTLRELWVFAPLAFRYRQVTRHRVLPLFPEYIEGEGTAPA
jgi:hypothetical protein